MSKCTFQFFVQSWKMKLVGSSRRICGPKWLRKLHKSRQQKYNWETYFFYHFFIWKKIQEHRRTSLKNTHKLQKCFQKRSPTSVDDRFIRSAYAVNISIFSLTINHLTLRKYLPSGKLMPSKGCLWDPVSRVWQLIEAWHNTDTMTP